MAVTTVGIDGYPRGWVAATCEDGGPIRWGHSPVDAVADLCPPGAVIGIDIPVGLVDRGLRPCDTLAQAHLGAAAASVFTTPPRAVLEAHLAFGATSANTQRLSRELTGQGTTPLALALARRILAVDRELGDRPGVIEVHPECAFREMAPHTSFAPKSSAQGVMQRMAAVASWVPDHEALLETAPPRVGIDDALDALAALWTAQRWLAGRARTLPPGATERPFIAF